MEDNLGTNKFSLQDWVMKRAANQSGDVLPPRRSAVASIKSEEPEDMSDSERENGGRRDIGPRTFSMAAREDIARATKEEISSMPMAPSGSAPQMMATRPEMSSPDRETTVNSSASPVPAAQSTRMPGFSNGVASALATPSLVSAPQSQPQIASAAAPSASLHSSSAPLQQLQIVRLLQDLGDRLRQNEKEREILWRELESCRKLIGDAEDRSTKAEKAYLQVEGELGKRNDAVEELVARQVKLETSLKEQADALEQAKQNQAKVQEKISSLETTAGSAIVRIEDALSENTKLARRLEQIGQDKARLIRKIETMEEALSLTQDTLKAKALVLLTDQALAAKTPLPQAPAWTGNDTLKVAAAVQPAASPFSATAAATAPDMVARADVLAGITASLKKSSDRNRIMLIVALMALGLGGGAVLSKISIPTVTGTKFSGTMNSGSETAPAGAASKLGVGAEAGAGKATEVTPSQKSENAVTVATAPAAPDQVALMDQAAKIASQIEPGGTEVTTPPEFDAALKAEQDAVASFRKEAPTTDVKNRIQPDRRLPAVVKSIEDKALAGDAGAQHDLAAIYTAGHAGVKADFAKGARWFDEAAHNGIANAQYNLGVLYHQGLGVKADTKKAIDLYRVAASNGHPEAEYNLGIAYIEGVGADYSPQIAAVYFNKAAEGGVVEAAYNLGLIYENGLLGESQPDEAVFWYTLAADKGNAQAKEALSGLKKQLSMTDEDAKNLVSRMAVLRPSFADEKGKARLPDSPQNLSAAEITGAEGAASPLGKAATEVKVEAKVKAEKTPTTADKVKAAPVKAKGTNAAIIAQIQEQLIRLGLYSGSADGVVNAQTEEAVKNYQSMNKLKVDGKPSEDVLVHMLASEVQSVSPATGKTDEVKTNTPARD